jgi:hypothetical protein
LIWYCCYSPYRLDFPFFDYGGTESGSGESESRKSSRRRRSRRSSYVTEVVESERTYGRPDRHPAIGAPRQDVRPLRDRDLRPGRRL